MRNEIELSKVILDLGKKNRNLPKERSLVHDEAQYSY